MDYSLLLPTIAMTTVGRVIPIEKAIERKTWINLQSNTKNEGKRLREIIFAIAKLEER